MSVMCQQILHEFSGSFCHAGAAQRGHMVSLSAVETTFMGS